MGILDEIRRTRLPNNARADQIGYKASRSGSTWQTVAQKLDELDSAGVGGAQYSITDRAYGAVAGDQTVDNIDMIQAAIDAAYAAGGGDVTAPSGATFYGAFGGTTRYIQLKDRVRLVGNWKIKAKDGCGPFEQMIGSANNSTAAIADAAIVGIWLDANAANNDVVATPTVGQRQIPIKFFNAQRLEVWRCKIDYAGIWALAANGTAVDDVDFSFNRIRFIPKFAGFADDNSAIYFDGLGANILDNRLYSASGTGARGGIEFHGACGAASYNIIRGFKDGINVVTQTTAASPEFPDNGISADENEIYEAANGIRFWLLTSKTLRQASANYNKIYINNADRAASSYMGVGTVKDSLTGTLNGGAEDLEIVGNLIRLQAENRITTTEDLSGGIIIDSNGAIDGLTIAHNRVRNSPLNGIRVNAGTGTITDMDLFRNRAKDCGNNTLGTDGYRAAFTLAGSITDSAAEENVCIDTGSPNAKGKVFFQNLTVIGSVFTRANRMRLTSTLTSLSSAFSTATGEEQVTAFLVGGSSSLDTRRGTRWDLTCNGATPNFTLTPFGGYVYRQKLRVNIINTSGGAGPTITWSGFKMASWTNPANGFRKLIEFEFDGTNYYETWRSGDIPN